MIFFAERLIKQNSHTHLPYTLNLSLTHERAKKLSGDLKKSLFFMLFLKVRKIISDSCGLHTEP